MLAVAAAGAWIVEREPGTATFTSETPGTGTPHLAILPLRVLDGSGSQDASYIGVGIADAITTRLANIPQIGVAAYDHRDAL